MKLSKSLSKLLIAGLALVTITATGASASNINVNAKRRPRTHRVAKHIRKHAKKQTRKHAKRVNKKATRKNKKAHKVSRVSNGSYYSGEQAGKKAAHTTIYNEEVKPLRSIVYASHPFSKSWNNGFKAGVRSSFNAFAHMLYHTKIYDIYDHPNSESAKDTGVKEYRRLVSYVTNYGAHHSKSATYRALSKYLNKRIDIENAFDDKVASEENENYGDEDYDG